MHQEKVAERCSHTQTIAMQRNLKHTLQMQLDDSANEHKKCIILTALVQKR